MESNYWAEEDAEKENDLANGKSSEIFYKFNGTEEENAFLKNIIAGGFPLANNFSRTQWEEVLMSFYNGTSKEAFSPNYTIKEVSGTEASRLTTCEFGSGFRSFYGQGHWWATSIVAGIGIIANSLVVLVLTRKNMKTPTNLLLLGLALADLLVSIEYVPYALSTLIGGLTLRGNRWHSIYVLIHAHLSHVVHTIAIWMTVALAFWRWVSVWRPYQAQETLTAVTARKVLLGVYVACPTFAIPSFLMYSVEEIRNSHNQTMYRVGFSDIAQANNELLKNVNFFLYSVGVKLVPCLLLAIIIPGIIRGMWVAARKRQLLTARPQSQRMPNRDTSKKDESATERTTRMLLVLMILFLLTEGPQGLLTALSLIYGKYFYQTCYLQFGDFMDLLALINSAINFLLYYVMSMDFRNTFLKLVYGNKSAIRAPSKNGEATSVPLQKRKNKDVTTTAI